MIKLHLGCGKKDFGKDWIHIDGGNFPHLHSHNIINLPFQYNTVDVIYASHVLEYFDRIEAKRVLKEWYSVLKPKTGILRLAVPDFNSMVNLYVRNKIKLEQILGPLYGRIIMGNSIVYHKTVYDYESLEKLLTKIGFSNIKWYDWRKTEHAMFDDFSQAYIPHMDKENGTLISLNVEGIKNEI